MQAVLLPVGEDVYAVLIDWVREVVTAPPLTSLVTGPDLVLGLFNLRGEIVPLLDTAALLGLGPVGPAAFAVVVRSQQGLAGLTATAFPHRTALGPMAGPSDLAGTAGTYHVDRQVVVLLDPGTLLAPHRLGGHHPSDGVAPRGAA